MEKTLSQLVNESKEIKTKDDRVNFISRNLWDLLDLIYPITELDKEVDKDAN